MIFVFPILYIKPILTQLFSLTQMQLLLQSLVIFIKISKQNAYGVLLDAVECSRIESVPSMAVGLIVFIVTI